VRLLKKAIKNISENLETDALYLKDKSPFEIVLGKIESDKTTISNQANIIGQDGKSSYSLYGDQRINNRTRQG